METKFREEHYLPVCGADKGKLSDDKDVSADEKQKFCKWKIPQESCVITMCRVDETVFHNLKIDRWAAQGSCDITGLGLKSLSIACIRSECILQLA